MKIISESELSKLPHKSKVVFALFCAEQVQYLVKDEHKQVCEQAIVTAKLWLEGKASNEECKEATNAATAATAATAAYTAYAAANAASDTTYAAANAANAAYAAAAASAATYAAYATNNSKAIIKAQWDYYKELLAFETIIEDVVLA